MVRQRVKAKCVNRLLLVTLDNICGLGVGVAGQSAMGYQVTHGGT